jgi:hypothetical protein
MTESGEIEGKKMGRCEGMRLEDKNQGGSKCHEQQD